MKDFENPAPGEGPFFTDYLWMAQQDREVGIEYINWNETEYTYLAENKSKLIDMFNQEFAYRELGSETEERFQHMLQIKYNMIADKYNHAYKVVNEIDVDKLGTGYKFTESRDRNLDTTADSKGTENRDNKFKDTPSSSTSTLNNPTNQTLDDRSTTTNITGKEVQTDEIEQNKETHDRQRVVELSELIDRYRQINAEFVNEFNECFMGIF